jgi:transcriptional regulator with XRE-family HTH domain
MTSAYDQGSCPQIEIYHRLRIARQHAGLEQGELADRIGVSRNTVSNAENNRVATRRLLINAWALACGVPVSWILTGEQPGDHPDPSSGLGIIRTHTKVCRQQRTVSQDRQKGA